jgi:hypothetical protein
VSINLWAGNEKARGDDCEDKACYSVAVACHLPYTEVGRPRQTQALEQVVRKLGRGKATKPRELSDAAFDGQKFTAKGLASHRKRLGLSASPQTLGGFAGLPPSQSTTGDDA